MCVSTGMAPQTSCEGSCESSTTINLSTQQQDIESEVRSAPSLREPTTFISIAFD